MNIVNKVDDSLVLKKYKTSIINNFNSLIDKSIKITSIEKDIEYFSHKDKYVHSSIDILVNNNMLKSVFFVPTDLSTIIYSCLMKDDLEDEISNDIADAVTECFTNITGGLSVSPQGSNYYIQTIYTTKKFENLYKFNIELYSKSYSIYTIISETLLSAFLDDNPINQIKVNALSREISEASGLREVDDLIGSTRIIIIKTLQKYGWEFRNTKILDADKIMFETDVYKGNIFYCNMKCNDASKSDIKYDGPFAKIFHGKLEDMINTEGFRKDKSLNSGLKSSLGMLMWIAQMIYYRDLRNEESNTVIVLKNGKKEVEDMINQDVGYLYINVNDKENSNKEVIESLKDYGYDDEYQILDKLWSWSKGDANIYNDETIIDSKEENEMTMDEILASI